MTDEQIVTQLLDARDAIEQAATFDEASLVYFAVRQFFASERPSILGASRQVIDAFGPWCKSTIVPLVVFDG